MAHQVTLGGDRLGSGKRNKVELHGYERSTHDRSYVWRSTMSCGTLVPFLTAIALPGSTHDIHLNADALTHPPIGPLFGSFKLQLDVFQAPFRLYQGKLHMNMLGIGMEMSKVPLPQYEVVGNTPDITKNIDNQQINPSSLFAYLGIRGVGVNDDYPVVRDNLQRNFNAIALLAYWEIYKNYYANRQEEIGAVIDKAATGSTTITGVTIDGENAPIIPADPDLVIQLTEDSTIVITATGLVNANPEDVRISYELPTEPGIIYTRPGTDFFNNWVNYPAVGQMIGNNPNELFLGGIATTISLVEIQINENPDVDTEPQITTFPLSNIDDMRKALLSHFEDTPYVITNGADAPYGLQNALIEAAPPFRSKTLFSQQGLGLKCYNSDLFNNWMQTEWIEGPDSIAEITAVDTTGGSFTIDELNMRSKLYNMFNRIAISGGSYDDWLDVVYDPNRNRKAESPIYLGSLIQNIVFQEVVSNAATPEQPLATLAGRGTMGNKRIGGQITAKVDEPSYLIGIVSITPNIDYSQGNNWDMNLKTMDDLHKPALDQIGFQDLVTDQMAWWDTAIQTAVPNLPVYKSAGKQPSWLNYMTNVNKTYGNFAIESEQMFMTLNRKYAVGFDEITGQPQIADMTTYIDPTKFNNIFADTRRDAQNFWVQIGVNYEARMKMSAKQIPNL